MKSDLKKIFEQFDLKFIVLFGSVAAGKTHKGSDVDIGVFPNKQLSFHKKLDLHYRLSRHFQKEADVSYLDRAGPLLLGQVAQHGKLLIGNENFYRKFRVDAMKECIDFEPYFQLRERKVKELIKQYA